MMGCMECDNVIHEELRDGRCPYCSSIDVHTMEDILAIAVEHRRFMGDLGLSDEEYE